MSYEVFCSPNAVRRSALDTLYEGENALIWIPTKLIIAVVFSMLVNFEKSKFKFFFFNFDETRLFW